VTAKRGARPLNFDKAPFPWFGGKSKAAPAVWSALGDVAHYTEPFAGTLAVLLGRPHEPNRKYHSETVNDLDGFLVNVWRSIQMSPDATAEAASWPVTEADVHARHVALLKWRQDRNLERMMSDPLWHDPVMAGWWLYGQCSWIGSGWCSGSGPWWPGDDGVLIKRPRGAGAGINRQLPHLSDDGMGVHRPSMREAGPDHHSIVMPNLGEWFRHLSARLRHVRVLNGSWQRACTKGALKILTVRGGKSGHFAGVFLDPPYRVTNTRADGLYSEDDGDNVSAAVQKWCIEFGKHEWLRTVLAGFDGEHDVLLDHGWTAVEWFKGGFLQGGMGNISKTGDHQQRKERLWLSPACLTGEEAQVGMLGVDL
jgi:hypothetical protein